MVLLGSPVVNPVSIVLQRTIEQAAKTKTTVRRPLKGYLMRVRQYFKGLLAWTFFLFLGASSGRNRAPNMIQLRTRPAVINMAPFQPNWFINLNCINKI